MGRRDVTGDPVTVEVGGGSLYVRTLRLDQTGGEGCMDSQNEYPWGQ